MSLTTREKIELLEYDIHSARVALVSALDQDDEDEKAKCIQLVFMYLDKVLNRLPRWKNEYPTS